MFAITGCKGMQMTLENGVTISIQFGPGNYCDKRDEAFDAPRKSDRWECNDAEVAIIMPNGEFYVGEDFHQVEGWQTVKDVVKWIEFASKLNV
jgi:hypothetical protein